MSRSFQDTMRAFDLFSQLYCQKFNGQIDTSKQEREDKYKQLGVYKMASDIHDSQYSSPLKTLHPYKQVTKSENQKAGDIVWWIFFVLSCIILFIYLIGLYFTYYDGYDDFQQTFSNAKIYSRMSIQNKKVAEMQAKRERDMQEQFQAPTQSHAMKELQRKKEAKDRKADWVIAYELYFWDSMIVFWSYCV